MCLRASLEKCEANRTPIMDPPKAKKIPNFIPSHLTDLEWMYLADPATAVEIPISLFEPKAMLGGSPRANKDGREINPPPPTIASKNPAVKAAMIRNSTKV